MHTLRQFFKQNNDIEEQIGEETNNDDRERVTELELKRKNEFAKICKQMELGEYDM